MSDVELVDENLLLLQVSELFLQGGHLIQALHPPPLTVLIIHLCSHQRHDTFNITPTPTVILVNHLHQFIMASPTSTVRYIHTH